MDAMAAPASPPPLSFRTDFAPETGKPVRVAPGIVRVTAPNAGHMTFKGTNSFLLGETRLMVVDPGPADDSHFGALMRAIGGRKVEAILLTHTHKDHSALAPRLRDELRAPIWFEGEHRPSRPPQRFERDWVKGDSDYGFEPDRRLRDGEIIEVSGMRIEVIATPGHCANHVCFGIRDTPWLLSGDHVMGWNSTLIGVPDGSMYEYLRSLRKIAARPYAHYLPAHGGAIDDGPSYARDLMAHREMRNEQIVVAVRSGARSIRQLQRVIYPNLALLLVPAARMQLRAHVEYLAQQKRIGVKNGVFGPKLSPA